MIDVAERVFAVAHQHTHGGGGGEDAGDAKLFDGDSPVGIGVRMIERAFERDSGAANQQRRVHHVAVPDDPADVRRCPPHIVRLQTEAPATHIDDMDLIPTVRVNRQLGPCSRAGRGEDERCLVRFHRFVCA